MYRLSVLAQTGLTSQEVQQRVSEGLTNAVDTSSSRSLNEIFRSNIFTRFNAILGAIFVVVLIAGSLADAMFGFLVIINAAIGIIQEWSAKRKLDGLALLHSPTTTVIREGNLVEILTSQVVKDDLVALRAGDQVPADGQLVESRDLEINEANLTGENDAVVKQDGDSVLSGTIVTAGSGKFIAESVGQEAYAHRIAAEAKIFTRVKSEIHSSIDRMLRYITWAIVIAVPLQLWSQFQNNDSDSWRDAVIKASAGVVGLVPEGLVLLTTLAFLTAAVQLTRQQVLVQELPAVEGLARVSVVCLDKTGTLTTGAMIFEGIELLGSLPENEIRAALGELANDPSANATLSTVGAAIPNTTNWVHTASIPFDSSRKWKATQFEDHGTWLLGAPEMLLASGSNHLNRVNELASTGRRVLAVCHSPLPLQGHDKPGQLFPVALVVLSEDIRLDAAETLSYFAEQDVRVMIISGDNPQTVGAIAKRVGIDVGEPIDARTLGSTPEELRETVLSGTIFGRVSPEQKRSIVQALQEHGEVVAMTGDGVNDALALKKADIGIAMDNGAPATKAVAQLILLDGKFAHLPSVLAEGRRVIGNVERVANLFLAKNVMSFVAILSAALISTPFPLLPRHLTLLSSITIGIPAFVLALGPNTKRYTPGFFERIVRFAVPAGAISGLTVVVADFAARGKWSAADGVKCSVVKSVDTVVNTDCWRVGSGATLAVLIAFFTILVVLARPLRTWKLALISSMIGLAVAAFQVPFAREFFNFNLPLELLIQSAIIGACGGAAIELVSRLKYTRTHHHQ